MDTYFDEYSTKAQSNSPSSYIDMTDIIDEMLCSLYRSDYLGLTIEELEDLIYHDINAKRIFLNHEHFFTSLHHSNDSLTLLQAVSILEFWEYVPILHQLGADPSDPTPLLLAIESDEYDKPCTELFSQFITDDNVNEVLKLYTPLHHALVMGVYRKEVRWDFIEELLQKGARVQGTCTLDDHEATCLFTCDPLIAACSLRVVGPQAKRCMEKIIATAGNLDRRLDGVTALEMAANGGHYKTCELLIKYGASIDERCQTLLMSFAIYVGAFQSVQSMVKLQAYKCVAKSPYLAVMHMLNDTDLYGSSGKKDVLSHLVDLLPPLTLQEVHLKNGTVDLVVGKGDTMTFHGAIWTTDLVSYLVNEACLASKQTVILDQTCGCCSDQYEYFDSDLKMVDVLKELGSNPASLLKLSALSIRKSMIVAQGSVAGLDSVGLPSVLVDFVRFKHVSEGLVERMDDAVCRYGL